jgi:hypothetical protein
MSNEIATLDQYNPALAAELGLTTGRNFSTLSTVHINYDPDDADKRRLPVGVFKIIKRDENGDAETFFAETVHFRPFMSNYQIRHWQPGTPGKKGKYKNQTILVPTWFDEMRDELGGTRCGKVKYKDWPELDEAGKEAQKNIKASRLVFGTVSFSKAEKVVPVSEVKGGLVDVGAEEEIACSWRMTKGNMMAMGDVLEGYEKQKVFSFARKIPISLKRVQREGAAKPSYNMVFDTDNAAPYPLDDGTVELIKSFQEEVSRVNKDIEDKYDKAIMATPTAEEEQVLLDITGGGSSIPSEEQYVQQDVINNEDVLAGDFAEKPATELDDEIPF